MQNSTANPLSGLMRKPKLSFKFPSKGLYWPAGTVELNDSGEYKVYSLTARDEINLKNPTQIMNGQALAKVIENCIPSVKNTWELASMDIDACLIAIKIASSGPIHKVQKEINGNIFTFDVDLAKLLDDMENCEEWDDELSLDEGVTVFIKPIPYKMIANLGKEAIETQKIMNIINDETADDDKKIEVFKKSFSKLTNLTMEFVQNCVYRVNVGDEVVENPKFINEFIENCDSKTFSTIKDRIDELTAQYSVKPFKFEATEEMKEVGITEDVEVELDFDISKFFSGDDK